MTRKQILLLSVTILLPVFGEMLNVEEDDDHDDPIVEDISKVDLSKLEIISREVVPGMVEGVQCQHLQEEALTYRYKALTASGLREEIHLGERKQIPTPKIITKTKFTSSDHPEKEHHLVYFPYLDCLQMNHNDLVQEVKSMIDPPSEEEYNFDNLEGNINGYSGHPGDVDRIVYGGQLKNGFFVEAGSVDSETNSDTLYFEMKHNWTGLLVEPMPATYYSGLQKHRKAHSIQTCLSIQNKTQLVDFDPIAALVDEDGMSRSMGGIVNETGGDTFKIQCIPLYTILLALGNPTVHWISLDIEGGEFPVLRSIPWDKVDIKALTVETHFLGKLFPGDMDDLIEYMKSVGYTHIKNAHKDISIGQTFNRDDLFVRNDVPLAEERLKVVKEEL